ncbi:hypothetical protein GV828_10770 [Flavobacterium sp. NST-5]|uniref:Lipoprotein n=1 Tax=Flavobacterium ichthyis TaxID=2698827 RepID=A0ABW9ZFX9_9FLAO|nr:DUF6252 family protein [Flavobacterium ichthyis]NBL65683.1 hypothetical protein [Flavobacterium ichthyis]
MKNFRFLTLLFAMLSLFAVSCDNEPIDPSLNNGENPENPGNELGAFSVDFNGQTYSTTSVVAVTVGPQTSIIASAANGETFMLSINDIGVGVFPAAENFIAYFPNINDEEEMEYVSINIDEPEMPTGTITISSIANGQISGTFSGTVYNEEGETIVLTNGVFTNITYETPEFPVVDNFTASINNTPMSFSVAGARVEGESLMILGMNPETLESINILAPANISVGNYPIMSNPFEGITLTVMHPTEGSAMLESGVLSITQRQGNRIVGTFSGTGTNQDDGAIEITNGSFDLVIE